VNFAPKPLVGRSLADQAVERSTERVVTARAREAELLMRAATEMMVQLGFERRATVADIVAAAGLSNQAFYRNFASKDDLIAALVDAGARRLVDYLAHQQALIDDPREQIRVWIRGVLSQAADPAVAAPTRAVAWNRGALDAAADTDARGAEPMIWALLEAPFAALGAEDPPAAAYLTGRLVFAVLIDVLWAEPAPPLSDLDFVTSFVLARVDPPPG
jgi:AcrR family transcriptional regulator